ncbi:MAG: GLUG motif-containing protein, partial [Bacteroidales bacterium]
MKKLFTLLIILSVSFLSSFSQTSVAPVVGNGTESDPYQISSLENLVWIAQNTSAWNKHFLQTADIDASETSTWNGGEGWMPIGNSSTRFYGQYNGNGYSIDGLYINRPGTNYQGLFGFILNASVLNLGMTSVEVTGNNYVGSIAGYTYRSTVENCFGTGNIEGYQYVGGLVGYLYYYSGINNSYSSATTGGYNYVGGLAGYSYYSPVSESHSTADITATNYYAGGLIGYISHNSDVDNCYSTGDVTGNSHYVGGITGRNYSTITRSYSSGNVAGSNSYTGGLVGYNNSVIKTSYSTGSVTSTGNSTGGIAGRNYYGEISNSYSTADVSSTSGQVGGLIGSNYQASVNNSYSTGSVSGSWDVGGLVGYQSFSQTNNSFWDTETSGQATSAGGAGKTTDEMKDFLTFIGAGWFFKTQDVEGIWNIGNSRNDGYPYLDWQYPDDTGITDPFPPFVTTDEVTGVTLITATVHGTVTIPGNPVAHEHGICWNATGNPSLDDNKIFLGSVTAPGSFTSEIPGLSGNVTYYVRAFAINSEGISYGSEISFMTCATPEGSGTQEDPYKISSLADLYWITLDNSRWNKHYLQTADIDASQTSAWNSGKGWMPIGNNSTRFTGSYDGGGYTINGLYINRPDNHYQGLFGYTQSGASILNLGLTNTDITGSTYVGGLAGYISYSAISGSYTSGNVSGNGEYVGGLAGHSHYSSVNESHSTADVTAAGNYVGGLIGYISHNSDVDNCYSTGDVTGNSDYVGGITGRNYGTITRSYSSGNVTGTSSYTGGLVGYNNTVIKTSYSTGSVTSTGNYTGGLAGYNYYGEISNSYSTADVSSTSGHVGGLIGRNYQASVNNSYSTGSVSGSWSVGGLVGNQYNSRTNNSFWNTDTSGQGSSAGGEGKTTAEMQEFPVFSEAGWDFKGLGPEGIWNIGNGRNDGYPYLS